MFQMEDNTLIKYTGTDTALTVPEGIREIGWDTFFETWKKAVLVYDH